MNQEEPEKKVEVDDEQLKKFMGKVLVAAGNDPQVGKDVSDQVSAWMKELK